MQDEIRFAAPHLLAGKERSHAVLLAFSGGADSSALLHLLAKDSQKEGYPLVLAHVNHGIRGDEALRDRAFCADMAEAYGLEICFADLDIPALAAESGRSLEEEARVARYDFFASVMQEKGISILATAHHADDNLETLLFRISRGSTLRGLCGIAPSRAFGEGGVLVRPLLQATRSEIMAYCSKNDLVYVTDSTNTDLFYARNRIRGRVVPILEELFSSPQHRATELCEGLRQDEDFLSFAAMDFLERWKREGCPVSMLGSAHPAIQTRVISAHVREWTGESPEQIHVKELLQMAALGQNGAKRELPGGWFAVIERNCLRILSAAKLQATPFFMPFSQGIFRLEPSGIVIGVEKCGKNTKVHNLSTASYIFLNEFSAIINDTLYWRTRKEGDTLVMGGKTRKLRKLYNEKKIPLRQREQMPLLCDEKGILWAPFLGARDGVSLDSEGILISVELPCEGV